MGYKVKRNLARIASTISSERGIPLSTVETVLRDYRNDLVDSVKRGERIVIDGLTSIYVLYNSSTEFPHFADKRNLSRRVRDIVVKRGLAINVVDSILRDYLVELVETAKRGEDVVIDGLATISINYDPLSGEVVVRGKVSNILRSLMTENGVDVSVRGRVSDALRRHLESEFYGVELLENAN